MQNLDIGQRVIVRAISTLGYAGDTRIVDRCPIVPVDAVVTGQVIRYLGTYHRARGGPYGIDIEDYSPAELHVSSSVELWCVRAGMKNREHLVHDADLEPGSLWLSHELIYLPLPKRAPRLVYIPRPAEPEMPVEAGEVKLLTFHEPLLLK